MIKELVLNTVLMNFVEEFKFGDKNLHLHFYHNARGDFWSVDVYPENSKDEVDVIVAGLKIMPNKDVFEGVRYLDGLPEGYLVCLDSTSVNDREPVTRFNFGQGKKYTLWYWDGQGL